MKWYWWAAIGLGAWFWMRPKAASNISPVVMSQTMYDQLLQRARANYPTLTNITITPQNDGSMTFVGQGLAPDGKSYITIKMFTAGNADDALAKINAAVIEG